MEIEVKKYLDGLTEVKAVLQCAHDSLIESQDLRKEDSALVTLSMGLKLWRGLDAGFSK